MCLPEVKCWRLISSIFDAMNFQQIFFGNAGNHATFVLSWTIAYRLINRLLMDTDFHFFLNICWDEILRGCLYFCIDVKMNIFNKIIIPLNTNGLTIYFLKVHIWSTITIFLKNVSVHWFTIFIAFYCLVQVMKPYFIALVNFAKNFFFVFT